MGYWKALVDPGAGIRGTCVLHSEGSSYLCELWLRRQESPLVRSRD